MATYPPRSSNFKRQTPARSGERPRHLNFRRVARLGQQWFERVSDFIDEEMLLQYRWAFITRNADGSFCVRAEIVLVIHTSVRSPATGERIEGYEDFYSWSPQDLLLECERQSQQQALPAQRILRLASESRIEYAYRLLEMYPMSDQALVFLREVVASLPEDNIVDVSEDVYLRFGDERDLTLGE